MGGAIHLLNVVAKDDDGVEEYNKHSITPRNYETYHPAYYHHT